MTDKKPSVAAMRAANKLAEYYIENMTEGEDVKVAQIIDDQTGLPELVEKGHALLDIVNKHYHSRFEGPWQDFNSAIAKFKS